MVGNRQGSLYKSGGGGGHNGRSRDRLLRYIRFYDANIRRNYRCITNNSTQETPLQKQRVTYCVRDGNIDEAFQDHRAELVHDLNHGFVVILQITKIPTRQLRRSTTLLFAA